MRLSVTLSPGRRGANRPPGCGVPWKMGQLGKWARATARQAAGRVALGSANLPLGFDLTERRTLTPTPHGKDAVGFAQPTGCGIRFSKTRDVSHQDAGRRDASPQHADSDTARRRPATQRTTQLKGTLLRIPSPPLKPPLKHDSHWYVTTHATGARSSLSHTRHPYANSISPSTIAAISHVPSPPPEGTPPLEHG